MNHRWALKKQLGFTIVELLVVITVIGILAAIALVTYTSTQTRALDSNARTDLANAAKLMDIAKSFDGAYPTTLPSAITPSNKIALTLAPASTLPYYVGVNPVQNGVLLSQICQNLIDEGKGRGVNSVGGTETYIMGCGNWNDDSMQITAYDTKIFPTPIAANVFTDYAASVPPTSGWHLNRQSVTRDFYTELHARFLAQGGSYPINSFWDFWANPGNGGVMYQALPAPLPGGNPNTFCIQATAGSKTWNVRPSSTPSSGSC